MSELLSSVTVADLLIALAIAVSGIAAVTDFRRGVIPNWLTFSAIVIAVLLAAYDASQVPPQSLILPTLFLTTIYTPLVLLFSIGELGGGDLKLLIFIGICFGPQRLVTILLIGCGLGCCALVVKRMTGGEQTLAKETKKRHEAGIELGPFLFIAVLCEGVA